jgi:hypothetical protein
MKSSTFWDITPCRALLDTCFMLVSCSAYYSTQNMEEICSSETSSDFQWATRRYIPDDTTLHNHRYEIYRYIYSYTLYILGIKDTHFGKETQSELLITTNDNLRILYEIFPPDFQVGLLKICKRRRVA